MNNLSSQIPLVTLSWTLMDLKRILNENVKRQDESTTSINEKEKKSNKALFLATAVAVVKVVTTLEHHGNCLKMEGSDEQLRSKNSDEILRMAIKGQLTCKPTLFKFHLDNLFSTTLIQTIPDRNCEAIERQIISELTINNSYINGDKKQKALLNIDDDVLPHFQSLYAAIDNLDAKSLYAHANQHLKGSHQFIPRLNRAIMGLNRSASLYSSELTTEACLDTLLSHLDLMAGFIDIMTNYNNDAPDAYSTLKAHYETEITKFENGLKQPELFTACTWDMNSIISLIAKEDNKEALDA